MRGAGTVDWKEAALAGLVVGLFALSAGMSRGFMVALPGAVISGLIGFAAYWFLMPFVIRWMAKGIKPKEEQEAEDDKK